MYARLTQAHLDHADAGREHHVHSDCRNIIFDGKFHVIRKT